MVDEQTDRYFIGGQTGGQIIFRWTDIDTDGQRELRNYYIDDAEGGTHSRNFVLDMKRVPAFALVDLKTLFCPWLSCRNFLNSTVELSKEVI